MKRPRAPIACYRCHHKKVRCDGIHPNCTRCLSTGVICAYPSSRRSRNTQPTNVDPFIDNLSQLEARIRRIETDLESQRALVRTVVNSNNSNDHEAAPDLTTCMLKTEKELQESRSIVAQLRLKGEQRVARGRRAAAAAAAAKAEVETTIDRKSPIKKRSDHRKSNHKRHQQRSSPYPTNTTATAVVTKEDMFLAHHHSTTSSSFYFPTNTDFIQYFPNTTTTTFSQPSSYGTSAEAFSDCWPLLNEDTNEFVDPMIIAAAIPTSSSSATDKWLDPPLLAVSSYNAENGSPNQHLNIPHLQPSSSTSTTSSQSFSVIQQQAMYSTQPLMDDMIMLDPHHHHQQQIQH
ncbi:MAG: hypothetical protein EXX96DRAFT_595009 [Benjaminiella poitrasii]|nr:MAG: hypothetical protein EXX96DRAFT_595009 [Benjaminiella poitrasii]